MVIVNLTILFACSTIAESTAYPPPTGRTGAIPNRCRKPKQLVAQRHAEARRPRRLLGREFRCEVPFSNFATIWIILSSRICPCSPVDSNHRAEQSPELPSRGQQEIAWPKEIEFAGLSPHERSSRSTKVKRTGVGDRRTSGFPHGRQPRRPLAAVFRGPAIPTPPKPRERARWPSARHRANRRSAGRN